MGARKTKQQPRDHPRAAERKSASEELIAENEVIAPASRRAPTAAASVGLNSHYACHACQAAKRALPSARRSRLMPHSRR